MKFDPELEKERVYEYLSSFQVETDHKKRLNKKEKSIEIALDEYNELLESYVEFFKSISHLTVFSFLYEETLRDYTTEMLRDLKQLIEREYTKENIELMSNEDYLIVLKQQQSRAKLLKSVAHKYLK